VSAEEVTTQAMRVLRKELKNGFQECIKKLYENWQKCVAFEGNVM
jgi:hypothetical protein